MEKLVTGFLTETVARLSQKLEIAENKKKKFREGGGGGGGAR